MAASDKREEAQEQEKTIPVFTVLKNNAILKNIFLLDNPPSVPDPEPFNPLKNGDQVQEFEETLLVGRHPDCNITLEHPSISRFHLRIHSKPSSHKLSVIDLSSVHGTWVLGKKIEPGIRVELNEGDTVRLASSSRVYRLHWVPVSCAYDMENPFVPPSDVSVQVEESKREGTHQDQNGLFVENNEIQLLDNLEEGMDLVFCNENLISLNNVIPSAPPLPEYMNSPLFSDEEVENSNTSMKDHEHKKSFSRWSENQQFDKDIQIPQPSAAIEVQSEIKKLETSPGELERNLNFLECLEASFSHEEIEKKCSLREDYDQSEMSCFFDQPLLEESVNSPLPSRIVISRIDDQQLDKENQCPEPLLGTEELTEIENPGSFPMRSGLKFSLPISLNSSISGEEEGHQVAEVFHVVENEDPLRKHHDLGEMPFLQRGHLATESVKSCLPGGSALSEIEGQQFYKANQSPQIPFATGGSQKEDLGSPLIKSEQKSNLLGGSALSEIEGQQFYKANQSPQIPFATGGSQKEDLGSPLIKSEQKSNLLGGSVLSDIESQQFHEANQSPQTPFATGGSQKENPGSPLIKSEQKSDLPGGSVLSDIESQKFHEANQSPRTPFATGGSEKENPGIPLIESEQKSNLLGGSVLLDIESQQFHNANQSPRTPFVTGGSRKENPGSPLIKSEQKSELASIWSRRGKPSSVLQIQTGRSMGKRTGSDINAEVELLHQEDIENDVISKALFTDLDDDKEEDFTPDKENFTPNTRIMKSMKKMGSSSLKNKVISKAASTGLEENEEPFTPDKENFTPNTLRLRSMKKKMGKVEEKKHFKLHRSPCSENAINPSGKEIQTPKVLQEQKPLRSAFRNQERLEPQAMVMKSRAERVPFQPLLVNSSSKSKSEAAVLGTTSKSSNYVNYVQTIGKNNSIAEEKRWTIVVDTTCLLNKESRTALQLLQGLKGTQLIIPRIVIRELDCMNRRGSLFRRLTEVSSALQWIEECMVNTNWWIHVQSLEEEGRPIAPTPPASPQSRFSEGNGGLFPDGPASSVPFSAWWSLLEIVSPTAEDHILECALLSRRINNDGQLVLLTNDVTLKIKAMAEGLVCETAQEFRDSLVNPFSERFLWADSSPRGRTWKPSKLGEGGAKGLKLILLHNSRYALSSVI
ncbi:hypothetical protein CsSME_00034832 [Camellia sinensis var. sinensis]